MGKVSAAILGATIGGFVAAAAMVFWFGWGLPGSGQAAHVAPSRADHVDLLLTVVTIFLGAIGVAVTVGALVIGLVALKTLREIKTEAPATQRTRRRSRSARLWPQSWSQA